MLSTFRTNTTASKEAKADEDFTEASVSSYYTDDAERQQASRNYYHEQYDFDDEDDDDDSIDIYINPNSADNNCFSILPTGQYRKEQPQKVEQVNITRLDFSADLSNKNWYDESKEFFPESVKQEQEEVKEEEEVVLESLHNALQDLRLESKVQRRRSERKAVNSPRPKPGERWDNDAYYELLKQEEAEEKAKAAARRRRSSSSNPPDSKKESSSTKRHGKKSRQNVHNNATTTTTTTFKEKAKYKRDNLQPVAEEEAEQSAHKSDPKSKDRKPKFQWSKLANLITRVPEQNQPSRSPESVQSGSVSRRLSVSSVRSTRSSLTTTTTTIATQTGDDTADTTFNGGKSSSRSSAPNIPTIPQVSNAPVANPQMMPTVQYTITADGLLMPYYAQNNASTPKAKDISVGTQALNVISHQMYATPAQLNSFLAAAHKPDVNYIYHMPSLGNAANNGTTSTAASVVGSHMNNTSDKKIDAFFKKAEPKSITIRRPSISSNTNKQ
ncbi:hypothetical protein MP638_005135 [Amoeboaphelidium occidentale]|nr:hypothetical protein MP638_005135 [Amoeboaphelidium occidentale]